MLEGEISEINLVERLVELWREQFTGAIRFENDGIIKIVYFKGGDVLSASTNDRSDSIDEILMRAGKVSREHVKQALAKRKENETLGDALLNLGFITRKELTWARRVQVVGVIRSIAAWTVGSFTIVADYLPKRDEGTLFPLPQILVELIVTDQDRIKVERALEGGNSVFTKSGDFDAVFRRLGLNEDADAIVAEVDGEKSAAEVATASGKDTFNVYKLLHALATLGILARPEKPQEDSQFSLSDFGGAGVADAADIWSEPPTPAMPTLELDVNSSEPSPVISSEPDFSFEPEPEAEPQLPEPQFQPSAWDEPEDDFSTPVVAPAPAPKMPAWNAPPRESAAVPMPATIEPAVDADEEAWGFDDAQIETAQRATSAAPIPPPAPSVMASSPHLRRAQPGSSKRFGLLIALFVLAILAAAGYYGFVWWQGRQDAEAVAAAADTAPAPTNPPASPTAPTATIVEVPTGTDTATTLSSPGASVTDASAVPTATMATATVAPPPVVGTTTTAAPAPVAAAPASVAPAPNQALPPVVRRTDASRSRYDAMARDFAANTSGNFTIQIQILCETSNLDKVMREGGSNVWFVPQPIKDRSCYRVFWGRYTTRDAAQQALASVPAALRDRSSAVRPIPRQ
jgi:septal ring-binding cell division protein DamX